MASLIAVYLSPTKRPLVRQSLRMGGRRASGAYHAASLLTATVVSRIIAFLSVPVLVGNLSTDQYGTLGLVQSIIPLAAPIVTLGVAELVVIAYNAHDLNPERGTLLQTVFTYTLASSVVVVPLIAIGVLHYYPGLDHVLVAAAAAVVTLTIIRVLLDGLGQAERRVEQVAISRVAREAGLLLSLVGVMLLSGLSLRVVLVCYALAEMYAVVVLIRSRAVLRSLIALSSLRRIREVLTLSMPLVPHALSVAAVAYSDRWLIGWKLGLHEVAVYTLACQLAGVLGSVYSALNESASVRYHSAMGGGGVEALREAHRRLVWWYPLVAIGAAMPIMAGGWIYLRFLAPPSYYAGVVPMGLILCALILHSMYLPFANVLFALRRTHIPAIASTAAAVLNVAANAVLIPVMGISGAAVATLLSYAVLLLIVVGQARRFASVGMRLADLRTTIVDARTRLRMLVRRLSERSIRESR